jgi:hypothetical protein
VNTVEYIQHWAKLHDVSFDIQTVHEGNYTKVKFNDGSLTLASWHDKEIIQTVLYDLVYGVRGDVCPDTVRHEEDIF